ncbi:uncharacterized protein LOC142345999 [Convolutriloba macropyga]|uniref:uncharacterized protein LOC142345999 n=1 Tax=Convolutriloba macropyga TaxID=536237 RepID=UPI003F528176
MSQAHDSVSFKADLSKVLNSEAKDAVLRWSQNASEDELKIVAKFFHEVGQDEAGKRLDSLPNLDKLKNTDVIRIIRDRSKRLRLLSPETRKNKFEHQTWHHMPPLKKGSYEFAQSHYRNVRPPARGHYVYHPDLYP